VIIEIALRKFSALIGRNFFTHRPHSNDNKWKTNKSTTKIGPRKSQTDRSIAYFRNNRGLKRRMGGTATPRGLLCFLRRLETDSQPLSKNKKKQLWKACPLADYDIIPPKGIMMACSGREKEMGANFAWGAIFPWRGGENESTC